ncbi:MAG: hypothetical protein ACOX7N_05940 [Lawsonibacter sp.]
MLTEPRPYADYSLTVHSAYHDYPILVNHIFFPSIVFCPLLS